MSKKKSKSKTSSKKAKVKNKKGKMVDPDLSKQAKNNRDKGQTFELECVKALKPIFPKCARHLEFQASEAEKKVDISYTENYDFQCKRGHHYSSVTKIEEIPQQEGRVSVLLTRGDKKKAIACLYMDDFIALLEPKEKTIQEVSIAPKIDMSMSVEEMLGEIKYTTNEMI